MTMSVTNISGTTAVRRQSLRPLDLLRRLRDPSPPVAGLLVDLCGVLYDDTVWQRWLLKLVSRLGLHTNYTAFYRVWQRDYLERVRREELDYWQALRLFLRAAGLSSGQIDEVEAAGHARRREFETEIIPLPGVVNVLARLTELGIHLTLYSSAWLDTESVRERLRKMRIDKHFHEVMSAPDVARTHRETTSLKVAIDATNIAPFRLCYVGRDTSALAAARDAGLRTVAVNHDDDAEADVHIGHIDQLLDALPWDAIHSMVG